MNNYNKHVKWPFTIYVKFRITITLYVLASYVEHLRFANKRNSLLN